MNGPDVDTMRRSPILQYAGCTAAACLLALAAACGGMAQLSEESEPAPAIEPVAPAVDRSEPPPPAEPRPFVLPEIEKTVLDNGLELVIVRRPHYPTISARVTIPGGFASQPEAQRNPAYPILLARLLRDGTAEMDALEVAQFIDRNGIRYDASARHETWSLSADALSTKFDEVIELLSSLLLEPAFPEDRLTARRDEYIGELELAQSQPDFHMDRMIRRVLFPEGSPYAIHAPTIPEVQAVVRDELTDLYDDAFVPNGARLILVGDLPEDAAWQVESAFGEWAAADAAFEPAQPASVETCNVSHVVLRPNSAQTAISWIGPGVSIHDDAYISAVVANQVVGGGPSARLFMNLREDKSYTYGAYSRVHQHGATAAFRAFANVRGDVTGPALDEFVVEFRRFLDEPLGSADLMDAKAYLAGVFPIELQTSAQLANRIQYLMRVGVPLDYLESYRDWVAAVGEADAESTGEQLFEPGRLALIMVGEEQNVVENAAQRSARVFVYDLAGELVREVPGEQPSTCADDDGS